MEQPLEKKKSSKKKKKTIEKKGFDSEYPTADGPLPAELEREISEDILPRLIYHKLDKNQIEMVKKFRNDPEIAKWIYEPSDEHYFHTDFYLTRFLIAREWDFAKSKEMFINAMKWRKENNVDNIIEEFEKSEYYDVLSTYWPGSVNKAWDFWTWDNSFVSYSNMGSVDTKLVKYVPQDVIIRFHIYCSEILERKFNKIVRTKGYFPGVVIIDDLEGLGVGFLDQKVLAVLKEAVRIDSDYYPAILRKFYLTNTPKAFAMVWGIVKNFFDKATLDKFSIHENQKLPILKDLIPPKYLPQYLEGECPWKMPDPSHIKEIAKKITKETKEKSKHLKSGDHH